MATYNKRGYKAPKEKVEKEEKLDNNFIEDTPNVDAKDSATAKAFDTLDETASKTEEWVAKNQKVILGVIAVIALAAIGYLLFQKYVAEPKQEDATEDLFVAQQNFNKAVDATVEKTQDSLFTLVIKGAEGKQGAVGIAEQYSGTDAGNLANYYAGIASLNLNKYDDAIKYLTSFKSTDAVVGPIATGAIGDAYSQKNDFKNAMDFYEKAARQSDNEFTTPKYLMKAGQLALTNNDKATALKYFTEIKEKFETAQEAQQIDALIGMAQ